MITIYEQCVRYSNHYKVPRTWKTDLTYCDRRVFEKKPDHEFVWVLYDHGTQLIDLTLKPKRGDLTIECIEKNCRNPKFFHIKEGVVREIEKDVADRFITCRFLGKTPVPPRYWPESVAGAR